MSIYAHQCELSFAHNSTGFRFKLVDNFPNSMGKNGKFTPDHRFRDSRWWRCVFTSAFQAGVIFTGCMKMHGEVGVVSTYQYQLSAYDVRVTFGATPESGEADTLTASTLLCSFSCFDLCVQTFAGFHEQTFSIPKIE